MKDYGQAWVAGTKAAFDPERMKQGMQDMIRDAYFMPTATVNTIGVNHAGQAGPPVAVAMSYAQREATLQAWSAPEARGVWLDRIYTATPLVHEIILGLALTGLDPSEIYGVYPSSELLHPARLGEQPPRSYWEWCVVHAGGPEVGARAQQAMQAMQAGRPPSTTDLPSIVTAELARGRRWIDRPKTAPLLHDEEVAAMVAVRGGIDPARCYGLSRLLVWGQFGPGAPGMGGATNFGGGRPAGGGAGGATEGKWYMGQAETTRMVTVEPVGVRIMWQATPGRQPPFLPSFAPVPYAPEQAPPAHVALLDWSPIALAIQRVWTDPPADPNGFPHLPTTPQELLSQYLRVVGVRPEDSYGVSTSVTGQQSGFFTRAGLDAERGQACSLITAVYRDRPEYQEGRARFEQYRAEVLRMPLGVERTEVGRFERMAYGGMKVYLRHQVGDDLYQELGGDDMYDSDTYPYLAGPPPVAPPHR